MTARPRPAEPAPIEPEILALARALARRLAREDDAAELQRLGKAANEA